MEYDGYDDCLGELISSEQLNAFSVIDQFCNVCERITAHHIDESENENVDEFSDEEVTYIKPLSVHECVTCARDEEAKLDTEGFL